jgi:uncharacterized membrane protein
VLPTLIFYLFLGEILGLVVSLATPIAEIFSDEMFGENLNLNFILALILLIIASFIVGLALRVVLLQRIGVWFENVLLNRLPGYSAVKSLSRGLAGAKEDGVFKPAILRSTDGSFEIVYLIEDINKEFVSILIPLSPTSFAGSVKIIQRERVELLEASLGETSGVLSHWGVGAKELLEKSQVKFK